MYVSEIYHSIKSYVMNATKECGIGIFHDHGQHS